MLRRDRLFFWFLIMTAGLSSGCASIGIKNGVPYFSKSEQYEPDVPEEDKWSSVRKTGRGNRPLEDEHDPFKSMLMSKEAQDIERNLGYK